MRKINWPVLIIGIILQVSFVYLIYTSLIASGYSDDRLYMIISGFSFFFWLIGYFFILKPLNGESTKKILLANMDKYLGKTEFTVRHIVIIVIIILLMFLITKLN